MSDVLTPEEIAALTAAFADRRAAVVARRRPRACAPST